MASQLTESKRSLDAITALLIFSATFLYWVSLPHSLQPADESVHLYEAKRLLNGEVLYRDFFNFITPGWFYLMASLFWLFGASIETARAAMAVVHGATAVLIYLTCRRLEIRTPLACLPVLAYLAVCQSAWPLVSQHWISTVLCAALLFLWSKQRGAKHASVIAMALVLGALISVQQQRGAFMAVGIAMWLCADRGLAWWYGARSGESVIRRVMLLSSVTVLVVAIVLAVAIMHAGFAAVWNALVVFPLFNYRNEMSCAWGEVNLLTAWYARFTSPRLLTYLPCALILSSVRFAYAAAMRRDLAGTQSLLLLLIFCAASAASIAYFPDFIKISFIAFAFCIAAAENLEWLARLAPLPARAAAALAWTMAGLALAVATQHLSTNATTLRQLYPASHPTAFGRVDYASADEARLRDEVDRLLSAAGTRTFYAYPILADLYLTVPADNPTPYGFFFAAGYHSPEQVQDVINLLRERRPPYIVALPDFEEGNDPVLQFILAEYEPVSAQKYAGRVIYRRVLSDER